MNLESVELKVKAAIAEGAFPGAAFAVLDRGRWESRYFGQFTYCPESTQVSRDTLWDMASVSKVIATTTVAMRLVEQGKLDIEVPVANTLSEFGVHGKERITPRDLLEHKAGLIEFRPYQRSCTKPDQVWTAICGEKLIYPTGTKSVYSDLSMITLAKLLEKISGDPFEELVKREVFAPAKMETACYSPALKGKRELCATTETMEHWRSDLRRIRYGNLGSARLFGDGPPFIQGEVHDPSATVLEGVAGHAGLFATLDDVRQFLDAFLGDRLVSSKARESWTKQQSPLSSRALGWDTKSEPSSAGHKFGPRSYGHTGYTGTCLWIDPDAHRAAILLTNRVHPTSDNLKIRQFRPVFHDAVVDALG